MNALLQLVESEEYHGLRKRNGARVVNPEKIGKVRTITIQNPTDIGEKIEQLIKETSPLIPEDANAYVTSEFNPDAQFEKDGKMYSVYAVQFYLI